MDLQAAFLTIRDIPYRLPTQPGEEAPNCLHKGLILAQKMVLAGVPVRGRIAEFAWASTPFPPDIIRLWPADIQPSHFFIEMLQGNEWIALDPSWDSALAPAGFKLAVWGNAGPTFPLQRIYTTAEQTAYLAHWQQPEVVADYFTRAAPFLNQANLWLQAQRQAHAKT